MVKSAMDKNYDYSSTKDKIGLYKVNVEISPRFFASERNKAIEKLGAEVEVKGFRKGQVPVSVLEGRFADQAVLQVIKSVSFEIASAIIKEKKEPVLSPLNVKKVAAFELGKPFTYEFEFLSAPEVDLKKLKRIKVEKPLTAEVTQEEIDKVMEEMWQEDRAKIKTELTKGTPVDKTTLLGPDGKPISAVKGKAKKEEFSKATLTDDWAKKIDPSAKSLAELEDKIKQLLNARKAQYSNSLFEHNLFEKTAEVLEIGAPADLTEAEMVNREEEFYATARLSGASPVEFLRSQGLSIEKLRETWKAQAQNGIKQLLIITGIAKAAKLEVSDDELKEAQAKTPDSARGGQEKPEQTRIRLLRQRVVEYLKSGGK